MIYLAYILYVFLWFSFLHSLLGSLTYSLILSTTLGYFTLLLPFFPPSLECPEVLEMEQWWLRWSAPTRTTQVVTNKPSNTLESCVLPILSGLAACSSLAKARHHFKCHIAEKSLSLSPRKKRERQWRNAFLYLKHSTVSHLEPASQTLSGLGLEKAGLLVLHKEAQKQTWAQNQTLDCKKCSASYKTEILLPAATLCED